MSQKIKAKMNLDFLSKKPGKIVAVGLNYKDHADESGLPYPDEPVIFMKATSSLIGPGEKIIIPKASKRVDYEAELAIVIGTDCKNVKEEDALDYVEGYTCLNDVTARDLQAKDNQWIRSKSFDTFCPIGPKVMKVENPNNLDIALRVNGIVRQKSNTKNMIFSVEKIICFISSFMPLEKGDIITTGTPAGIGQLKPGDIVEVEIEKIGILKNTVK